MRDKSTNYIGRWKYCGIDNELVLFILDGTVRIDVENKTKGQLQSRAKQIKMTLKDKADLNRMLDYLFGDGR